MNNPEQINSSFGPPPPPVETKNQPPQQRPSMHFTQAPGNRQDINAARGTMFREQGVDLTNNFVDPNKQERSIRTPSQPQIQQQNPRPEMRGPQNPEIDNILSGLKTRTVNIHEQQQQPQGAAPQQPGLASYQEDDSMISISSLKDMQNTNMPKRTNRRKNRSDKNTISLDI
jgi:hypothetical protein